MSTQLSANTAPEVYELPKNISEKLTPKQRDTLLRARGKAILEKTAALQMQTLKAELDDEIETTIGDDNLLRSILPSQSEITTESIDSNNTTSFSSMETSLLDEIGVKNPEERDQGVIEKGIDIVGRASDTVEHYISKVPGIKSVLETTEDFGTTTSRWSQIWENPKQFFTDLWSAFKAMFTGDFSKIKEFFSGSSANNSIRKGMAAMDKILDFSPWRLERWNELLVDDKEFRNITIENLWKAQRQSGDIAENLGIKTKATYINTFVEDIFTPENYQKLSAEVQKNTGKTADEVKKMKISDFVKAIAS